MGIREGPSKKTPLYQFCVVAHICVPYYLFKRVNSKLSSQNAKYHHLPQYLRLLFAVSLFFFF